MRALRVAAGIAHGIVLALSLSAGVHAWVSAPRGGLPAAALDSRLLYAAEVTGALAVIGMLLVMLIVRGVIEGRTPVRVRDVEYPADPAQNQALKEVVRDIGEMRGQMRELARIVLIDNPQEGE